MKPSLFFKLSWAIVVILFLSQLVSDLLGVQFADVVLFGFIVGSIMAIIRFIFMVRHQGEITYVKGLALGVFLEVWDQVVASNLFRTYEWMLKAKDRSANVLGSSVVHIPQAGVVPNVVRDRVEFPVPVTKRPDSDITYAINELSSDNTHIRNAEKIELNYDKIADVLADHINQVNLKAAQLALYRWFGQNPSQALLNAGNIIRTSGSATAGLNLPGATGNRNKFLIADVANAKTSLIGQTKKEMNDGRRALVLNESMYQQLKGDPLLTTLYNLPVVGAQFSNNGDLIRIHGFDIIRTDCLPRFNNSGTPNAKDPLDVTVVSAATDNDCALMVDFDKVHIAKDGVKVYQEINTATWQGDIYSITLRMGASRERNDQAGVIAIVQQ